MSMVAPSLANLYASSLTSSHCTISVAQTGSPAPSPCCVKRASSPAAPLNRESRNEIASIASQSEGGVIDGLELLELQLGPPLEMAVAPLRLSPDSVKAAAAVFARLASWADLGALSVDSARVLCEGFVRYAATDASVASTGPRVLSSFRQWSALSGGLVKRVAEAAIASAKCALAAGAEAGGRSSVGAGADAASLTSLGDLLLSMLACGQDGGQSASIADAAVMATTSAMRAFSSSPEFIERMAEAMRR